MQIINISYICSPKLELIFELAKIYLRFFLFMVIFDHYSALDEQSKIKFRDDILKITGWSYTTFYYKMKNDNFSKLEREAIERYIAKSTRK